MTDELLALALTGSRAASFNHDCASKLQSLFIALDEITEIAEASGDAALVLAAETATGSVRELNTLLVGNRALTKAPVRTETTLRELFVTAAERVSVRIVGELPERPLQVAVPAITHVLALLIDLAAELTPSGRAVTIEGAILRAKKTPQPALLALAEFALGRDGGSLAITPAGFAISFA